MSCCRFLTGHFAITYAGLVRDFSWFASQSGFSSHRNNFITTYIDSIDRCTHSVHFLQHNTNMSPQLRNLTFRCDTLADQVRTACLLEAIAPKVGNVHPLATFDDMDFGDFVRSADAIAGVVDQIDKQGVGQTILECVQATQKITTANTNLGMVLLLIPMTFVPQGESLQNGIETVLANLDDNDTTAIYEAIQLSQPGGMGDVPRGDVSEAPTMPILDAMRMASSRDRIARAYVSGFGDVLRRGNDVWNAWTLRCEDWREAVVGLQLTLLARWSDSLIDRKCGMVISEEAAFRAQKLLDADWPEAEGSAAELEAFDQWLRADGNRRNPGTTADLIAAILFASIREQQWTPPKQWNAD